MEEGRKRAMTFVMACFVTHRMGLPIPGSPLVFLPPKSLRQAKKNWPTSLRRGEGRGVAGFWWLAGGLAW